MLNNPHIHSMNIHIKPIPKCYISGNYFKFNIAYELNDTEFRVR